MWRVTADPDQFDEAVQWLRSRVPVTREAYDELDDAARAQSFTIGGTQQLRVVQTVLDEITRAVESGESIESFRDRIEKRLRRDYTEPNSARLTTAFRTTTQMALNTGRWFQMQDPVLLQSHPYRIYDAVLDTRTTETCRNLDGKVFHHEDEFLLTNWPPLHHNCRTGVRAIRTKQAMDIGPQSPPKKLDVPKGFGLAPPERETWEPDAADFDPKAFAEYVRKQRALEARRKKPAKSSNAKPKKRKRA